MMCLEFMARIDKCNTHTQILRRSDSVEDEDGEEKRGWWFCRALARLCLGCCCRSIPASFLRRTVLITVELRLWVARCRA